MTSQVEAEQDRNASAQAFPEIHLKIVVPVKEESEVGKNNMVREDEIQLREMTLYFAADSEVGRLSAMFEETAAVRRHDTRTERRHP